MKVKNGQRRVKLGQPVGHIVRVSRAEEENPEYPGMRWQLQAIKRTEAKRYPSHRIGIPEVYVFEPDSNEIQLYPTPDREMDIAVTYYPAAVEE